MGYKSRITQKTSLKVNKGYQGEPIENKIRRVLKNNEAIKDVAPLIYTERKDGVLPDYDIRADRQEVAIEAMGTVAKSNEMKRDQRLGEKAYENMTKEQQEEFHTKFPHSEKSKTAKKGANKEGNKGSEGGA